MPSVLTRHYRVAARDSFTPGAQDQVARSRHLHAEAAERQLRARLAAGERPQVMLVAPEQATSAKISRGGRVTDIFAWLPDDTGAGLSTRWTHHPHVAAELAATAFEPDPASKYYADNGSVHVRSGRVRALYVSPWLGPVSEQLKEHYGVPVHVDPGPELPAFPPPGEGMTIIRRAIPEDAIDELLEVPPPDQPAVQQDDSRRRPRVIGMPPWDRWGIPIGNALALIASRLEAPVNFCEQRAVVEYRRGESFVEHTDLTEDADTWDRTVSFTLMLNEPGKDFRGGEFEVNGEVVDLHRGDLVGFTSTTRHAVQRIRSGRRLVMIAFGEYRR